jgi:hypothetical protein
MSKDIWNWTNAKFRETGFLDITGRFIADFHQETQFLRETATINQFCEPEFAATAVRAVAIQRSTLTVQLDSTTIWTDAKFLDQVQTKAQPNLVLKKNIRILTFACDFLPSAKLPREIIGLSRALFSKHLTHLMCHLKTETPVSHSVSFTSLDFSTRNRGSGSRRTWR